MNNDQLSSIVRSLLKIAGALLIASQIKDAQTISDVINGPDVFGLAMAIAGFLWSHVVHYSDPTPPAPTATAKTLPALIMSALLAGSLAFGLVGCKSTPQQAAYQTAGVTATTIEGAMQMWGAYVAANHPGPIVEAAVQNNYEKYEAAMVLVCDAGAIYAATSATNAPAAQAALSQGLTAANSELSDLLGLLAQYGIKIKK